MLSRFTGLSLKIRLASSFVIILTLLILISLMAIEQFNRSSSIQTRLANTDIPNVLLTHAISEKAEAAALELLQILLTTDRDQRIPLYKRMDQYNADINKIVENIKARLTDESNALSTDLQALEQARLDYHQAMIETVEMVEFDPETALEIYAQKTKLALQHLLLKANALSSNQQAAINAQMSNQQSQSEHTLERMQVLIVSAVLLSILLAYVAHRTIIVPIKIATAHAQSIASGDLTEQSGTTRKDEIGDLENAMNTMRQDLRTLIGAIQSSAKQVQEEADAIAQPVQLLHAESTSQDIPIERIQQQATHLSEQSQNALDTAHETRARAEDASHAASEGQQLVDKAMDELKRMSESTGRSATSVEELNKRAESVRELISTVHNIAEQTNLLALNAAIEAARAGDQGRGFAVVADEVRNLANRTGEATQEINTVIDAMESESKKSSQIMMQSRDELKKGIDLVLKIAPPLKHLNDSASASLEMAETLENIVIEQAQKSADIETNIGDIGQVANGNKAASQQLSDITQHLTELSSQLEEKVRNFIIH